MTLTQGKLAGLKAVSNQQGVIAAVAMDQRGSLKRALGETAGDRQLEEFKTAVTGVLTPYASAVLLDPEWGLLAAKRRAANTGLLLAYERTGYDTSGPGRLPGLLHHWSVRRLKESGADCVKVLLYYSPVEPSEINDRKQAWIERIGSECRANDIPFFLELVGYEEGKDEKGYEYALRKPEIVKATIAEFTKPLYAVDVLKVEVPVNLSFVAGTRAFSGQRAFDRKQALDLLREAASAATRPFIYLSGGVSNAQFTESLELAAEAGVKFSGVLCGRATWKDGIAVYKKSGLGALKHWLADEGVRNISMVNKCLQAATPWYGWYDLKACA